MTGALATLPTSMVFIDGTNLDRVCLEKFGRNNIDFVKFLSLVSAGTRLLRAYYVTAPYRRDIDENRYRTQQGMINHLKRITNVYVDLQQHRMREVKCRACGKTWLSPKEKGTDVSVASLLVEQAVLKAADVVILVANDTDYGPALKTAKRHGRRCTLAYVFGSDDRDHQVKLALAPIWNECNRFIKLDLRAMNVCWDDPP